MAFLSLGTVVVVIVSATSSMTLTVDDARFEYVDSTQLAAPARYYEPLPELPSYADFRRACEATSMFDAAKPTCAVALQTSKFCVVPGPRPDAVTPGRSSAPRDTVPARSRRKLRVWEREELA